METLHTQDRGRPIVTLTWDPVACPCCGLSTWKAWHAPEGGILVQCDGATRR